MRECGEAFDRCEVDGGREHLLATRPSICKFAGSAMPTPPKKLPVDNTERWVACAGSEEHLAVKGKSVTHLRSCGTMDAALGKCSSQRAVRSECTT